MPRKLLAEAGYKGQPIRMITNKRYEAMFDAAVLAQAMEAEAGIKLELDVMDWGTELDRYNKGDYQVMSFGYSARLDPSLSFEMVSGDKSVQPRKLWDDPDGLALLASSMQVAARPERQGDLRPDGNAVPHRPADDPALCRVPDRGRPQQRHGLSQLGAGPAARAGACR